MLPDFVEVDIDSLNPAGDGVARYGRERLVVPFTIPGERVRVSAGARGADGRAGALLEVLRPSPHRVEPRVRAAAILVRLVLAAVPEQASVLDPSAGAGLFALPVSRAGRTS